MFHFVALAVFLGQATADPSIDARTWQDYNHLRMPSHGTVYKGMLYGFFDDDWAHKQIYGPAPRMNGIPIGKIANVSWKKYTFQLSGYNCRHHVGYGALWFSNSNSFLNRWDFEQIQEIEDSITGPRHAGAGSMIISGIPLFKLMDKYHKIGSAAADPKKYVRPGGELRPIVDLVAFDSVPISKDSCKTFLLMKKEKKFEIWDTQGAVFQNPGAYKILAEVKNLDTFDSPFTEDFYAFVRKNDYYFVTESGKLFHAPPPKADEKSRKMKALWDDAKRPIVAVIEDADRDKVWLFAKDKNPGAKLDLFFEMKETIQTKSFDPKKLPPVNVEGRAKTLLEYLPLISAGSKK